jgi:hypothetical protein
MLTLDDDGTIRYKDEVVGRHWHDSGIDHVEITLRYQTSDEGEWVVPLSWLAKGLVKLEPPSPAVVEFTTAESEVTLFESYPRLLLEKHLKVGGYNWQFNKSDPDFWPSEFHGHELSEPLKIDAIDGDIYRVTDRKKIGKLSKKELRRLHAKLREVPDLQDLIHLLPESD